MRLIGPLRERDFALFWTGTLVSFLGDGIYLVALPFTVLGLGGGAGSLSLVGLAWSLGWSASCSPAACWPTATTSAASC